MNPFQEIALERMHRLIELAEKEFEKHPERSRRYIQLIKKLGTRNKTKIPLEIKARFCKKCNAFFKEGKNVKKRVKEGSLIIECLECGEVKKLKLKGKEKK